MRTQVTDQAKISAKYICEKYPSVEKKSQNLRTRKQTTPHKHGQSFEQTLNERKDTNGKYSHEKVFRSVSH